MKGHPFFEVFDAESADLAAFHEAFMGVQHNDMVGRSAYIHSLRLDDGVPIDLVLAWLCSHLSMVIGFVPGADGRCAHLDWPSLGFARVGEFWLWLHQLALDDV
jgi:hypothetical protein